MRQRLPFAVDAVSFLGSASLLTGLPSRRPDGRQAGDGRQSDDGRQTDDEAGDGRAEHGVRGLLRDTWAGLRLLGGHRILRSLMVVVAVLGVGQQAVSAVLVVYAERRLGLRPTDTA
ncbi:hypothetical protein [Streptomyces roseochromogenus]|uniref:hypothetical protein n=1 Tax=Streptomyces roseochromogenus TaxID=285450 RepID=UPI001319F88B|nr:hypothetical protein [Streptomyces roseochromogenus]